MNSRHAYYNMNTIAFIERKYVEYRPTNTYYFYHIMHGAGYVHGITWILLYNIKLALALIFIVVMHFFDIYLTHSARLWYAQKTIWKYIRDECVQRGIMYYVGMFLLHSSAQLRVAMWMLVNIFESDQTKMFLWRVKNKCSHKHTHYHKALQAHVQSPRHCQRVKITAEFTAIYTLCCICTSVSTLCLSVLRLELSRLTNWEKNMWRSKSRMCWRCTLCANTLTICEIKEHGKKTFARVCVEQISGHTLLCYILCNRNGYIRRNLPVNHFWLRKALCKTNENMNTTWAHTHTHSMQFEGVLSQKVKLYLNVTHVYSVPTYILYKSVYICVVWKCIHMGNGYMLGVRHISVENISIQLCT